LCEKELETAQSTIQNLYDEVTFLKNKNN